MQIACTFLIQGFGVRASGFVSGTGGFGMLDLGIQCLWVGDYRVWGVLPGHGFTVNNIYEKHSI